VSEWPLLPGVMGDAYFPTPDHRLWLERRWVGSGGGYALHVGMNPSLAGRDRDDLTVRKDQEFTKRMKLSWMVKCNLGTLVSTDPNGLTGATAVCHPDNLATIMNFASRASRIVIATGKPPDPLLSHARTLFRALRGAGHKMECFGLTKDHWPKHSSRLAYVTPVVEFVW
jgi:hypothetical protein